MPDNPAYYDRRRFVQLAGLTGLLTAGSLTLPGMAAAAEPSVTSGTRHDDEERDSIADTYYQVLLTHTRWAETQWDSALGYYTAKDFGFAVVLGNAVLLTRGTYDSGRAGIGKDELLSRTLATIKHFAASNRLTGGTEWGRRLFFDTTFQLYFVLAARLLWDQLDDVTRQNVDTIAREQAQYTTALGSKNDPDSGSWTPNGLNGGFVGDTKLEEMGVYAQSLAPGLAWAPDDSRHDEWAAAFGRWTRNEAGLPSGGSGQSRPGRRSRRAGEHRDEPLRHLHRREPQLLRPALPGGAVAYLRPQRRPLHRRGPTHAPGPHHAAERGPAVAHATDGDE